MEVFLIAVSPDLSRRVAAGSGENAYKCYQCKRCTVGCPVAEFADLHPAQMVRAIQLGDVDRAVRSRFLWLCTGCQTCSTRCPQGIDVAAIVDELRMIARERGLIRADAPYANILKLINDSARRWGRLYEVGLLARDKLARPSSLKDDLPMGVRMLLRGKISPFPTVGDRARMQQLYAEAARIDAARGLQYLPIETPTGAAPAPVMTAECGDVRHEPYAATGPADDPSPREAGDVP